MAQLEGTVSGAADVDEEIPLGSVDPKIGPADVLHCASTGVGGGMPGVDRRYVTAALMLVMVLSSMEQTVTSTAMPTIIGELHGLEHYSWVASIYLLSCTVTMPLYGRLADVLGRRVVILTAILIFSLSSMAAASAHTMGQLILFRGLQGLGAGGIMPVVLTILGDLFTLEERAGIQGFFSGVWGTASLAGPALGALLVKTLGWRSIFFVNLPFGILGLVVLLWKYRDQQRPHKVDLDVPGGIGLTLICLGALLLVTRVGPENGPWAWGFPAVLVAMIVIVGIFFYRHEKRASNPILPPSFLSHRVIGPSLVGSCLMGICFLSLDTYVPLYVQGGRGGGATGAAAVVTPVMLTWAISGMVAAPMVIRLGFRKTAFFGTIMVSAGFTGLLICSILALPQWMLTCVLAITGFGFGPISMSYLLAAQDVVSWKQRGLVTSNVMFTRTMGGAVGIGALGGLFKTLIAPGLKQLAGKQVSPAELMDPHLRDKISPALLHSLENIISGGLVWVFAAMLGTALLGILVTTRIPKKKADLVLASEASEGMMG